MNSTRNCKFNYNGRKRNFECIGRIHSNQDKADRKYHMQVYFYVKCIRFNG